MITDLVFMDRVESILKQKKLTQKELAEKLGLRRPSLSEWKKNGSIPAGDVCLKIADYLKVSVEWLITGKDKSFSEEEQKLLRQWKALTPEQKKNLQYFLDGCENEQRKEEEKNNTSQA